ncbi:DUF262 domain-containing protein [Deferribacterales bacterium RsTz2092]|nr:hypothetical protein AGMMS49941_04930 [Deferribacterales bacterium]
MAKGSSIIRLRSYLKKKNFTIPNYQRGYKWAVKHNNEPSGVEKLMTDMISAHKEDKKDYFVQGITVYEKENETEVVIVDGQQRTTTFYFLLYVLDKNNNLFKEMELKYLVRAEAGKYISELKSGKACDSDEFQDVYYFKKAIEQIEHKVANIDKEKFLSYVLDNVKLLYIKIEAAQAVKTFSMMNGNKAKMLPVELIKAELLRNLPESSLRRRYAHEWDKWLYWWNREDVKDFFGVGTHEPMGLLIDYYYRSLPESSGERELTFDGFKSLIAGDNKANEIFKVLRQYQKSFEDIFNDPIIYNSLGMALVANDKYDKYDIISYFIDKKKDKESLKCYAKWRLADATHRQITKAEELKASEETKEYRASEVLNALDDNFVYGVDVYDKWAFWQLLRLNVEEYNKLNNNEGQKFDFSIWDDKSLEHILPKSKVYYKKDDGKYYRGDDDNKPMEPPQEKDMLDRADFNGIGSEHCIGNLLFLYKNENSSFGNEAFEDKKAKYFNLEKEFKSRNLLHTISVFAKSSWGVKEIQENKKAFLDRFRKDYGYGMEG